MHKTYVLGVLDGWGVASPSPFNAITAVNPEHYNMLLQKYPHSLLDASGAAVGLPDGQMGNSEVGHTSIGSGRVVYQDLPRINNARATGELAERLNQIKKYHLAHPGTKCHIVGLISDGGVHSHIDHIIAAAKALDGIPKLIHAITDGRDTSPRSCLQYIKAIEDAGLNIATISGRYYAMDRDKHWDRISVAFDAMFCAQGPKFDDCKEWVAKSYQEEAGDEFIKPAVSSEYQGFASGDTIFIINFRADRVRQMLHELINGTKRPPYAHLFGMVHYSDEFAGKIITLFPPQDIKNTLGEVLSAHHKKQLRLAETEKYAHVTYFFNGGKESPSTGEDRVMVPSPRVATYDLQPEMSVFELTDIIIKAIGDKKYDFICFNFANADMVGHTGDMPATIKAIEAIDKCLGLIYKAVMENQAELIITADHGNAEDMYDHGASQPHTAHTINMVPFIYVGNKSVKLKNGSLSDIAPTLLQLMNLPQPKEMSGKSLIVDE